MDDKFYMIYVEGKGVPSKIWKNRLDAEIEAERLCEKEGLKTFILTSTQKFEAKKTVTIYQSYI